MPHGIALTGGTLIDGSGRAPQGESAVLICDGKIEAVGGKGETCIPQGYEQIDTTGKTVMPGIADMHVHMAGGWDGISSDFLGFQRYLNWLLYAGVTTVFDVGNVLPFAIQQRDEVRAGRISGPRILTTGPLIDGPDPRWHALTSVVTSVSQIPGMVQRLHEAGVDALKAYQQLSLGQVAAIVNEGARYGLAVVLDSGRMNGCYDLMRHTGIKAWAHLDSLGPMMPHEIDYMVQHDVRQITTLAVIEIYTMRRFRDMSFLECPLIADTVPPHMLEEIRAWVEREFTAPSERRLRSAERLETAMRNALALHRAGVQLVAGTDAPYPGVFQGEGIHHELELLVEAGLTPVEAISCATANAAKLLGKESEWGTVAPGLAADLLVIEGHPDRNIADTRRIGMMIQGGRIIDRAALKHDPKQPDVRAVHCIS